MEGVNSQNMFIQEETEPKQQVSIAKERRQRMINYGNKIRKNLSYAADLKRKKSSYKDLSNLRSQQETL